jgi:CRISPR-associated protein (TIGR02584 family)
MEPHPFPRRILLCVTGLSPQIITETLYALSEQQRLPFVYLRTGLSNPGNRQTTAPHTLTGSHQSRTDHYPVGQE